MLDYLKQKKANLEAQKVEPTVEYADLDEKVEAYKKELYKARWTEIVEKNKIIDAQVAILDECIAEVGVAMQDKSEEAVSVEAVEEAVAEEVSVPEADETELPKEEEAPVIHYSKSV